MHYRSTRGCGGRVTAAEAILQGMAVDGGLFVPEFIPELGAELADLKDLNYQELAIRILQFFLTDFTLEEITRCVSAAYDQNFTAPEIAPLSAPLESQPGTYFLELFHGPTLAFKDIALTILPHLLATAVKKLQIDKEIVILTATSGDTGKAALSGFAGVEGVKIIVFYPEEGVSAIQKRQMTTQVGENTYVIGIKGNFDAAQAGVKEIFADTVLQKRLAADGFLFSSANSINIGRLLPQIVYYFFAYFQSCAHAGIVPGGKINFVVPTGNFGNILAGYYAQKMGLPLKKLLCASNENKVLYDFINTGIYDKEREFKVTSSPSMDILLSSNLERLLYHISREDTVRVSQFMRQLNLTGKYEVAGEIKKELASFFAGYANEGNTAKGIKEVFETAGYIMDTHTAVAYSVYQQYRQQTRDTTPTVIVSTASPYKFTADVLKSIDKKFADRDEFDLLQEMSNLKKEEIPAAVKDLERRQVQHKTVCRPEEMKEQVEKVLEVGKLKVGRRKGDGVLGFEF